MTISKRKPASTRAKVPAAKKPEIKKPAAPTVRRTAAAAASYTPAEPNVSPAPTLATTPPATPRNNDKRVRTSIDLPESQIALLGELKKRCLGFGVNAPKGELMTAGLQLLNNFLKPHWKRLSCHRCGPIVGSRWRKSERNSISCKAAPLGAVGTLYRGEKEPRQSADEG